MSSGYQPLLAQTPDARRSPVPLVDHVLLAYLAFLMGAPAAALLATINALLLRRWVLALETLAICALAWFAFAPAMLFVLGHTQDIRLAFIFVRLASLAVGIFLAWRQWPHIRGHMYLDGKTVPVLWGVIAGIAISSQLSLATILSMMGMP